MIFPYNSRDLFRRDNQSGWHNISSP